MKRFITGVGIGIAVGYLLKSNLEQDHITPERALKEVKKTVAQTHAVSGSWIHMIPETISRHHISYEVYRGGLSTTTEEGTKQYEFLVDRKTGTLLDLIAS
jgi:predicted small secreted protein